MPLCKTGGVTLVAPPGYDNKKDQISINPLFFVVELPMPMHPCLRRCHSRRLPFLDVLKYRKSGHRLARVALDSDDPRRDLDYRFVLAEDLQANLTTYRRQNIEVDERAVLTEILGKSFDLYGLAARRIDPASLNRHAGHDAVMQWRLV